MWLQTMAHASALASTRIVADELEQQRRIAQQNEALRRDGEMELVTALTERFLNADGAGGNTPMPMPLMTYSESASAMMRRVDKLRVRLYALGEHLKASDMSTGILVNLSATMPWDAMKAVLLNELYGESIQIASVNLKDVSLHLLPDGERIKGVGERTVLQQFMANAGRKSTCPPTKLLASPAL